MSVLGSTTVTLIDYLNILEPDKKSVAKTIVQTLSQKNEILTDMRWQPGNLPTGHQVVVQTGLPQAVWRKLNTGVPNSKSTTAQITETCASLEAFGTIDKDIVELNGNSAAFRASQNAPFMQAMNIQMAQTLFYGDSSLTPESFTGLSARFSTISGAVNGQNILSAGGSGSNNCSIWLTGWGDNSIYGIFPSGSKAGLQHEDCGIETVYDANGNPYRAYRDRYVWKCGMALVDWRYVARIANINVANLTSESGAADLIKLMSRLIDRLPDMAGITPVFYVNRTVASMLKIQALNKSQNAIGVSDALTQFGGGVKKQYDFLGIPIRMCDALLNTESPIT